MRVLGRSASLGLVALQILADAAGDADMQFNCSPQCVSITLLFQAFNHSGWVGSLVRQRRCRETLLTPTLQIRSAKHWVRQKIWTARYTSQRQMTTKRASVHIGLSAPLCLLGAWCCLYRLKMFPLRSSAWLKEIVPLVSGEVVMAHTICRIPLSMASLLTLVR